MKASFEMRTPPGSTTPVEYVRIGSLTGKDEVVRAATAADRRRFKAQYSAFREPRPAEPAEAVIDAAEAQAPVDEKPRAKRKRKAKGE